MSANGLWSAADMFVLPVSGCQRDKRPKSSAHSWWLISQKNHDVATFRRQFAGHSSTKLYANRPQLLCYAHF